MVTGVFTTTAFSGAQATITGISGFYNGSPITALLPPGTCCLSPGNDNQLFFPGPFLDLGGVGFQVGSLDLNVFLDVFISGSSPTYANLSASSSNTSVLTGSSAGTLSVTPASVTATPEPATIGLLGTGLIGMFLKNRKRA